MTAGIATAAAWLLAGVFTWAAVAKLRSRSATGDAFARLGLPSPGTLRVVVPVAELALAGVLVTVPRWGAVGALAALTAFTVFLVTRIRAGASVGCGCFGAARAPASWTEVARNAGLALLACAALVAARPAVPALPEAIVALTAVAVGAVGLALLDVRLVTGRLLDNRVPHGPDVRSETS